MEFNLDQVTGSNHFHADVCITGAGIAGLTLANALRESGLTVALLEGGGLASEERSQDLYQVEMAGQMHSGASAGRFRLFGGSSTQWGGQLLPYTDDVFDPPASSGMPRWPISKDDIERHYPQVLKMFGVADEPFRTLFLRGGKFEKTASEEGNLNLRFSRWAPFTQRNLALTLGKRCLASKTVAVYLHANVTKLELGGTDAVARVHASSYSGKKYTFSARHVVVSLGTIESARLLLASGIGNDHDQVGRYFHDHLCVHAATLHGPARGNAIRLFAPKVQNGVLYTPKLEATRLWRSRHAAQAVMAHFPIIEPDDSSAATVRLVLKAIQQRAVPPGLMRKIAALPGGSVDLLKLAYANTVQKRRAISARAEFRLSIDVEQRPKADSRITLSQQRDALGMPKARLDWKVSEWEKRTVAQFAETICGELNASNLGGIEVHPPVLKEGGDWTPFVTDTYHMMGGTRMGGNSLESVVDPGLRVHGIRNLYVASCSVFPSGGSSNPTFTMMALTLRLAEYLRNSRPDFYAAIS